MKVGNLMDLEEWFSTTMVKSRIHSVKESLMDIGLMVDTMGLQDVFGIMGIGLKGIEEMVREMEKGFIITMTEIGTKVVGKMASLMDLVPCIKLMEQTSLDTGKKINILAKNKNELK